MTTITKNTSVACSLGQEVQYFIQNSVDNGKSLKLHIIGRSLLGGTAFAGTIEMVSRLAFYCLGQIGSFFTFYQSETLNVFIKNQSKVGFSAAIITSASLFSLISPQFFTALQFIDERPQENPAPNLRTEVANIRDIIKLPFQMVAFCFKLPFYVTQLTLSLVLLPIRIALLPLEIILSSSNLRIGPNDQIQLDVF